MPSPREELQNLCNQLRSQLAPETIAAMSQAVEVEKAKNEINQAFTSDQDDKRQAMLNLIRTMMVHD